MTGRICVDQITNAAGTGAPDFVNGLTSSGNLTLGSSVLATPSGSAPSYTCRAWVNFNGTGTVAIRASGNVTSITDNGVGDYTVNFTTAMPDANYGIAISTGVNVSNNQNLTTGTRAAASVTVFSYNSSNALVDSDYCGVTIFR